MSISTREAESSDDAAAQRHPGRRQKMQQMVRDELALALGAALKLGAALLILEGLVWLAADSSPQRDPDVMTAKANPSHSAEPVAHAPIERLQTSAQQLPRTEHGAQ